LTPSHHPPLELLFDHAAGTLDPAMALVIETHLALCPHCRDEVATFECAGGELLEAIEPVAMAADAFDRLLRRIDLPAAAAPAPVETDDPILAVLPKAIRRIGAQALATTKWRSLVPGVRVLDLPLPTAPKGTVQLIKVGAGRGVPRHTHAGNEFTLVLNGVFNDENGHFAKGDLQITDPTVIHRPLAEPGDMCVVLAVTDAPLRLTGVLGAIQRGLGY